MITRCHQISNCLRSQTTPAIPHRSKIQPKCRRQTASGQQTRLKRRGRGGEGRWGGRRRWGRGGFSIWPHLKITEGQRRSTWRIWDHQFVLPEIKNTKKNRSCSIRQGQENVTCCCILQILPAFFLEEKHKCFVITCSYIFHCYLPLMLLPFTLLFIQISFNNMINS